MRTFGLGLRFGSFPPVSEATNSWPTDLGMPSVLLPAAAACIAPRWAWLTMGMDTSSRGVIKSGDGRARKNDPRSGQTQKRRPRRQSRAAVLRTSVAGFALSLRGGRRPHRALRSYGLGLLLPPACGDRRPSRDAGGA